MSVVIQENVLEIKASSMYVEVEKCGGEILVYLVPEELNAGC